MEIRINGSIGNRTYIAFSYAFPRLINAINRH
nr:MAG TPA: hypothetical protein [Bacteriophage sp.]